MIHSLEAKQVSKRDSILIVDTCGDHIEILILVSGKLCGMSVGGLFMTCLTSTLND